MIQAIKSHKKIYEAIISQLYTNEETAFLAQKTIHLAQAAKMMEIDPHMSPEYCKAAIEANVAIYKQLATLAENSDTDIMLICHQMLKNIELEQQNFTATLQKTLLQSPATSDETEIAL